MENIKNSSISAVVELVITHPIDYFKTLKQNKINNIYSKLYNNPYTGLSSRLIGIVPLRITFWSLSEYLKKHKYNFYSIPLIVSTTQTILDIPIEQTKMNLMNKQKIFNLPKCFWKGCLYHYNRNLFFAYGFYFGKLIKPLNKNNYFIDGMIGGLIGSIISHPFDSLKTYYQTTNQPKVNFTFKFYFRGIIARCLLSSISMSVGYSCFMFLQNL